MNDPSFCRVAKGIATIPETIRWSKWIEDSEVNREKANVAKAEIIGFEFAKPSLPDKKLKWSKLYARTVGSKPRAHIRRSNETKLKWIFRAAAIFLLISIAGLGVFQNNQNSEELILLEQISEEKTISTANDEVKTLLFSNGSKVVLSGNTIFTYKIGLLQKQTIDVTLEGEAWFDAESDPSSKEPVFSINTPDGIITDIGTKFMVTVKKGISRVVLQDGLVEVKVLNEGNNDSFDNRISIKKGEMVEFNGTDIFKRNKVNSTFYTSWATGYIELDETELQEFAAYVEHRFDVKVQIEDSDLTNMLLDGAINFKSLEGLVRAVSKVTGIPVYQSNKGDIVYIGNPNK
jgi:ferric-dicitrate binding protein FerR (iron transport regulator)